MKLLTVKELADNAGVSVRTLHYYDRIGLLEPDSRSRSGYRLYGKAAVVRLQQIMFFREIGLRLEDIGKIINSPDFDIVEALRNHRRHLEGKAERIMQMLDTIGNTIAHMEEKTEMSIKDYYRGFSNEKIEEYREEVRQRWGDTTLKESEERVLKMGEKKFSALQEEGGVIFQALSDLIDSRVECEEVREQVERWRTWLEHFSHYSDEAVLDLGRAYSTHPDFIDFFSRYHPELPVFLTRAIEHRYDK